MSALSKKFPASKLSPKFITFLLSNCIHVAKLLNSDDQFRNLSHSNEKRGHIFGMSGEDSAIAEGSDETFAIGISFGNSTSSIAHTSGVSYTSCSITMI